MVVRSIPKSFEYSCDFCETKCIHEAGSHNEINPPPRWLYISLKGTPATASGFMRELFLCPRCGGDLITHMEAKQDKLGDKVD